VIFAISSLKEGTRVERYRDYTYFFEPRDVKHRDSASQAKLTKRDSRKKLTYLSEVVQLTLNLR
jgi:hypothetical protein